MTTTDSMCCDRCEGWDDVRVTQVDGVPFCMDHGQEDRARARRSRCSGVHTHKTAGVWVTCTPKRPCKTCEAAK